jgi:hypothetical protein
MASQAHLLCDTYLLEVQHFEEFGIGYLYCNLIKQDLCRLKLLKMLHDVIEGGLEAKGLPTRCQIEFVAIEHQGVHLDLA